MLKRILVSCGLIVATSQGAFGQYSGEVGNAEQGRKIAEAECFECHDPHGAGPAASFNKIANTAGMTSLALSVWFKSPHPTMPNFVLPQETQEDLIAYIRSLKEEN